MLENKFTKLCLGTFCAIGGVIIMIIIINSVMRGDTIDPNKQYGPDHNYEYPEPTDSVFIPTAEDHATLDTMLIQVQDIEIDIDTLHIRIDRIESKIDDLIEEQSETK
jgi:peptidoglycan hydrolase CwlO-like protein